MFQVHVWGCISEQSSWSTLKLFPQPWEMLNTLENKKSFYRPSTLAVGIRAWLWHQCQNLCLSFWIHTQHLSPARSAVALPQTAAKQKSDKNQTISHLGFDCSLHGVWRLRLESVLLILWALSLIFLEGSRAQHEIRRRHRVLWNSADSNADRNGSCNFAGSQGFSEALNYFNFSYIYCTTTSLSL